MEPGYADEFDMPVISRITGVYKRSDLVGQYGASGSGLNSQIDDKTKEALIVSNLQDACQSLIRIENNFTELSKLNRDEFDSASCNAAS